MEVEEEEGEKEETLSRKPQWVNLFRLSMMRQNQSSPVVCWLSPHAQSGAPQHYITVSFSLSFSHDISVITTHNTAYASRLPSRGWMHSLLLTLQLKILSLTPRMDLSCERRSSTRWVSLFSVLFSLCLSFWLPLSLCLSLIAPAPSSSLSIPLPLVHLSLLLTPSLGSSPSTDQRPALF